MSDCRRDVLNDLASRQSMGMLRASIMTTLRVRPSRIAAVPTSSPLPPRKPDRAVRFFGSLLGEVPDGSSDN